jgi:hypothetical protein
MMLQQNGYLPTEDLAVLGELSTLRLIEASKNLSPMP